MEVPALINLMESIKNTFMMAETLRFIGRYWYIIYTCMRMQNFLKIAQRELVVYAYKTIKIGQQKFCIWVQKSFVYGYSWV